MLFVGDDWAEDHHDVHLMNDAGEKLASRRRLSRAGRGYCWHSARPIATLRSSRIPIPTALTEIRATTSHSATAFTCASEQPSVAWRARRCSANSLPKPRPSQRPVRPPGQPTAHFGAPPTCRSG